MNFGYEGRRLTSISSNDGRSISITYVNDRVLAINVAGTPARSISYDYGPAAPGYIEGTLTEVTLPDTSKWLYTFTGSPISNPSQLEPNPNAVCQEPAIDDSPAPYVLTMTHPSKLEGRFTFRFLRHYRNLQQGDFFCQSEDNGNYQTLLRPNYFDNWTLLEKRFSHPSIATDTWAYAYEQITATIPCEGCPERKTVTVTEPDGSAIENDFGVRYGINEGQLLGERTKPPGATQAMRSTDHGYLTTAVGPFPDQAGQSLQMTIDPLQHKLRPSNQSAISQQGISFTRVVNSFDVFARPLTETKWSNGTPAFSKNETVSYHDDFDIWVLAQRDIHSVNGIQVTDKSFDPFNARPLTVTEFGRTDRSMVWHPSDGNLHEMKDALDRAFTLANYDRGVATAIQLPTGPTTTATVDNYGNLRTVTDAVGHTTNYQYDARDRVSLIDYPDGDTEDWTSTVITTAPTTPATAEFGIPSGLWKRTEITGALIKHTWYDARWRPILTRETSTEPNTGATFVRRRFDHRNREVFVSYPSASIAVLTDLNDGVETFYDALDRVSGTRTDSESGALFTSTTYPSGALRQLFTDARSVVTQTDFQAYDQPSQGWPRRIVAALGRPEQQTTEITRDVFGKPTLIRRSGTYTPTVGPPQAQQLDRQFVYDSNHRLCKTIEPETGVTVIDYDSVNDIAWTAIGQNLTSLVCDRAAVPVNERSLHTFDAMRRLTAINHPNGTNDLGYSYFSDGALETATNNSDTGIGSNTWTYSYNKRRLLETEQLSYDTRLFSLAHGYNVLGHRESVTYPSGQTVNFDPDARGRPRRAGSHVTGVSRHANGAVRIFDYANGIPHATTQNLRQLPLRRTAGAFMDQSFVYDANGNLTSIDDASTTQPLNLEDRTLGYDGLNRLIWSQTLPEIAGLETFRYDALDNLRIVSFDSANVDYAYNSQQRLTSVTLNSAPFHAYTYNEQGDARSRVRFIDAPPDQILADGFEATFPRRPTPALDGFRTVSYAPDQQYTFDRAHRLVNVAGIERYDYDAHGRRVGTIRATDQARHFQVYSQGGQLLHSEDRRSNVAVDYIHLDGDLIAEREVYLATASVAVRYHHPDTRQSATLITGQSGQRLSRKLFAPYGSPYDGHYREGPGYAGHVTDGNTGLTYMQQRLYDPIAMRFLSPDPMGVDPGTAWNFNRYGYAAGNPYRYRDADGRIPVDTIWDAANVVYDLGKAAVGAVTGNSVMVAEGLADAALDGGAMLTPYVPAGSTKVARMLANASDGAKRQTDVAADLAKANPGARVQTERYLCDSNGKSVRDPVTNERRRVDVAVIQDGKAKTYEATSQTAPKVFQMDKEQRIRDIGGTFIRDKETRAIIPTEGKSELIRRD